MIEIGASLAAARRARGLELRDAERLTCMRSRYLTALEEERWDDLPGPTYARAFLRTYATALDLQADRLVAAFDEQVEEPAEAPYEPMASYRPQPRRRVAAPLTTATAAALLALVGWAAWSSRPHPAPIAVGSVPAAAAAPKHVAHVLAAKHTVRRHAVAPPARLVVRATRGACWVQVRRGGPAGAVLAERLLQPGQSLSVSVRQAWLRLGAPWNVDVSHGSHVLHMAATGQPVDAVF